MESTASGLAITAVQVRTQQNLSGEGETATITQLATAVLAHLAGVDIAAALGLPSYANLTAANTALASGLPYWNVALAKVDITTA